MPSGVTGHWSPWWRGQDPRERPEVVSGRFGWDIRERFLPAECLGSGTGAPGEQAQHSLAELRRSLDTALSCGSWGCPVRDQELTRGSLWVPSNTKYSVCLWFPVCPMTTHPCAGRAALSHLEPAAMDSSPEGKAEFPGPRSAATCPGTVSHRYLQVVAQCL